ncbi:MAG: DUF488 domain-containing protein [Planctomycetaceae bacterium]|nr:DUF488 domain-containing protein [Planctomycetaceae bacterium]
MTIYTLGYTGWKLEAVEAALDKTNGLLVDVRMMPRSRNPIWNSGSLAKRLPGRYQWLRQFGNRNYKAGPIEIVNFESGAAELLREVAGSGRSPVLFCGCADVNICHRKILAEWLGGLWQAEVVHLTNEPLTASENGGVKGQQKLF